MQDGVYALGIYAEALLCFIAHYFFFSSLRMHMSMSCHKNFYQV
jgi:hypothetical protein